MPMDDGFMEADLFGFTLTEISKRKYKVTGNNCPNDMLITIKKEGDGYRAVCNYSLSTRSNDDIGYQAMHLLSTSEETLKHLLISLKPIKNSRWIKCK